MARVLHGNVRASDDGRKYFVSGNQDIVFKVLGHEGPQGEVPAPGKKIITNGTDVVELLLVCIDRCRGDLKLLDAKINTAVAIYAQLPATVRAENGTNRSEGELGAQVPVGEPKVGGPVTPTPTTETPPSTDADSESEKTEGSGEPAPFMSPDKDTPSGKTKKKSKKGD